jgi:hypothetical protein
MRHLRVAPTVGKLTAVDDVVVVVADSARTAARMASSASWNGLRRQSS